MIYLPLFHWEDHPVSSETSQSLMGDPFLQSLLPTLRVSLSGPLSPAVLRAGTNTSLHCSLPHSPGCQCQQEPPRSLQSRTLGVPYKSRMEEMLFPNGRNNLLPNIADYHSECIFSRDSANQLYCSLTITNTSSKLQVISTFVTQQRKVNIIQENCS